MTRNPHPNRNSPHSHISPPRRSRHSTRRFVLVLLASGALSLLTGCKSVGSFYTRPRPASYYTKHYCFELPKTKALDAVKWFVKRYHYPVQKGTQAQDTIQTQPVHMPRFSRNREFGYTIGLRFRVTEHKGKLSLKHIPAWVFQKKTPKAPTLPQRKDYPNTDAFNKAVEAYQKRLQTLIRGQSLGVELMKKWRGCDVRTSTLRTLIVVDTQILAYPLDGFGNLKRKVKAKTIRSNLSLEYSILRVLGWRLGRIRYMRRLIQ